MRISFKIILPITLIAVIILAAAGYFLITLKEQENLIAFESSKIRLLNGLNERLHRQHEQTTYSVLAYRFNQDKTFLLSITQTEFDKSKTLDEMYPYIDSEKGKELIARFIESRKEIEILRNQLIKSIDSGNSEQISLSYNRWEIQNQNIKAALADIDAYNINSLEKTFVSVGGMGEKITNLTIILLIVISAVILFFYFYLRIAVTSPIAKLARFANEIANQKFIPISTAINNRQDELGDLFRTFNLMAVKLKDSYASLEKKVFDRTRDLEQAKAKNEAILISIAEGLVVVDNNGKIIIFNSYAEKFFGAPPAGILPKDWPDFFGMYSVKDAKKIDVNNFAPLQALQGKLVTGYELLIKNKKFSNGIFIKINAAPIIQGKKINGVVFTFIDISKEKEIDRAKSEFVSLASHQLRTPLSAINWYTEMLLAGDAGKINADQKSYLQEIYAGNRRMVDLVNTLLNVSRLELGTFIIEPEPTDLAVLAQSVLDEQKTIIEQKKQVIKADFAKDIPLVNVDPKLLRMVFQNLLSNAVKFTPDQGSVSLSLSVDKKNILFSVADTGYGITKEQQSKIFTKLFRADNVRAKNTEGTGLGLYIVKSIIDNSGGKIWFESEENKGSTFHVSLPLKGMEKKAGEKRLS